MRALSPDEARARVASGLPCDCCACRFGHSHPCITTLPDGQADSDRAMVARWSDIGRRVIAGEDNANGA